MSLAAVIDNNARWCDVVARTHGIDGAFAPTAWTSPTRTPRFYPDAITLAPGVSADDVLARIDLTTPDASVKDSFADLDLAAAGFEELFAASWFTCPPGGDQPDAWAPIDERDFDRWVESWSGADKSAAPLRPELLDDPDVLVLAEPLDDRIIAGAVAYRTDDVVGVTNLFAHRGGEQSWPRLLAGIARHWPTSTVVGYAGDADLMRLANFGVVRVGPLRVWIKP